MTDLREFVDNIIAGSNKMPSDIITFLEDNHWFGSKPTFSGKVELTDDQVAKYTPHCQLFVSGEKTIEELFADAWPVTFKQYNKFRKKAENRPDDEDTYYILDFLLYSMDDELVEYSNNGIIDLVRRAHADLTKEHGIFLTDFLAWLRAHEKTAYTKDFIMTQRYTMTYQNEAYEMDEFLELLYVLTNEEYIEDNEMYLKATQSRKYVDAWLYMAMHFICSLRLTDLERLPYPILSDPPEEVLKQLAEGTYDHGKILFALHSVVKRFEMLELKPHKTEKYSNIETVKLNIPTSCRLHYGTLFLIAEAHRELEGDTGPLIRKVSSYVDIKRAIGGEIAALFLKRDFGARSATKSFLQSRFDLTSEIMGTDNNNLAARIISHARSHKGSYGSYASQSLIYLKDAKFSGYTHDQIAYELMERGVCSFIPAMLLDMATKGDYAKADVKSQTELIKIFNISPEESELIVSTVEQAKEQARKVVNEIVSAGVDILSAINSIKAGTAFAKQPGCMCLMSAIKVICPYNDRKQCIGCKYEISTTSTLMLLVSEYKRLLDLNRKADNPLEKAKYKAIASTKIIPAIQESLDCLREYDEKIVADYESLIREFMHG